MTLRGLLAFLDPPKPGAAAAIRRLAGQDVWVRMVTGDNRPAAGKLAADVGLQGGQCSPAATSTAWTTPTAPPTPRSSPRSNRGTRSASSARCANTTRSSASSATGSTTPPRWRPPTSASRSTPPSMWPGRRAAIVLLDKSLAVVTDGVRLGRQTFANTLKYIRVTTSANFGNVLSMAIAAGFLPFLPLLPRQILLLRTLVGATTS